MLSRKPLPQWVKPVAEGVIVLIILALLTPLGLGGQRTTLAQAPTINFTSSGLKGATLTNPTSLQFGPDGRLYVSQQDGNIYAYTIVRNGPNDYQVTNSEKITVIVSGIVNHDDDGTPNSTKKRQVTGILVTGAGAAPVIYVTSSDWRIGGGGSGQDTNLDTNSGILSRLTWDSAQNKWTKVDLVRGLPRSEENHSSNGMALDAYANVLYVAQGGHTNGGSPSNNFAFTTEYALAAAVLSINLTALNALPVQGSGDSQYIYDLPTLDDPTRANSGPNGSDLNDPFGGNDGLNQAKIVPGGPVQVYASGFRNPYDLVLTQAPGREGRLYTVDNGANYGWGGHPAGEGPQGVCTNNYVTGEPGSASPGPNDGTVNNKDNLHLITGAGFYGGHPNPLRANPAGAGLYTYSGGVGVWRTSTSGADPLPSDWPPVPVAQADPQECDFRNPGVNDNALWIYGSSTNGMAEYTASNFGGVLIGDLLLASYDGKIQRIILNQAGDQVVSAQTFAANFANIPLDLTAQGDNAIFPGTVWAATYGSDNVTIFEPSDYDGGGGGICTGADSPTLDEDNDNYTNADEIDNGSDPCSSSIKPPDNDGDFVSDLNDTDDDNDGLVDQQDFFAIDPQNGLTTNLPIEYTLLNNDPGTGFFGLGFTGLMNNGVTDYQQLFNADNLIAGGAVGLFTIESVPAGDAYQNNNNQQYGFQFGLNGSTATGPFTVRVQALGNFFPPTPTTGQSQGLDIGAGGQDHDEKVAISANGGGSIQVLQENSGVAVHDTLYPVSNILTASEVDLYLTVDPVAGTAQPKYAVNNGLINNLGAPLTLSGDLLTAVQSAGKALAIGVIASRASAAVPAFGATWDHIAVTPGVVAAEGKWEVVLSSDGSAPTARHENAFALAADKFYLLGGRGNRPVNVFDPQTAVWQTAGAMPLEMHHFQAVEFGGLIYVMGALTGPYPTETPVPNVYIYNPSNQQWTVGPEIPTDRRRGSAGVAVYNNKIYMVGGIKLGHTSGNVAWLDAFDPATGGWQTLPDAPRTRDHFQAAVVGNKLYALGGRNTSINNIFGATVAEVDVYDFTSGQWSTMPNNVPTLRAGTTVAVMGNEILLIGGESMASGTAHAQTEALDVTTGAWRTLAPLNTGRHGTEALVYNGAVYIAAGSGNRGGGPELTSQELFRAASSSAPTISPANVDFGQVQLSSGPVARKVVVANPGTTSITIAAIALTGSGDFGQSTPGSLPTTVDAGQTLEITVTFNPNNVGVQQAQLEVTHAGTAKLTVGLFGETVQAGFVSKVLYRVNAGGPQLAAADGSTPDWSEDSAVKPSPYVTNGQFHSTTSLITKDASAPASVPTSLFQTERWDAGLKNDPVASEMQWKFPVPTGRTVEIRLYFAEIYLNATNNATAGPRVFNVAVDGVVPGVFSNLDIFAAAGSNVGIMRSFVTTSDGTVDIDLLHAKQNPALKGIEILMRSQPNTPPTVVSALPDLQVNQEAAPTPVNLAPVFTDAENSNALTYAVSGNSDPALVTATLNGATLNLAYNTGKAGTATITVRATDEEGAFIEDSFSVTVNGKPALAPVGDQTVAKGSTLNLTLSATDPEGDALTLMASGLPASATFVDNGNGLANLTWVVGGNESGVYPVTASATDAKGAVATTTFQLAVAGANRAPTITPITTQQVALGGNLAVALAASDPDGDPVTLTATGLPAGATLIDNHNNSGTLTWDNATPVAGISSFTVVIRATDPGGLFAEQSFVIIVTDGSGNQPPILTPISNQSLAAGNTLNLTISAVDPDNDAIAFSATQLPTGATLLDHGDGSASLIWNTTTVAGGDYPVTIVATDSRNAKATQSFVIAIAGGSGDPSYQLFLPTVRKQ